jgi:hypothetical protein
MIKSGFTVGEVMLVERAKGPKKTTELLFCGKVGTMEFGPVFILIEGVGGATNLHGNCGG